MDFWSFLFTCALTVFAAGFLVGCVLWRVRLAAPVLFFLCLLYFVYAAAFSDASPSQGAGFASALIYYGLNLFYAIGLSVLVFPGFLLGRVVRRSCCKNTH